MESLREYLSANVPAKRAPIKAPSSSIAARNQRGTEINQLHYNSLEKYNILINPSCHSLMENFCLKSFMTKTFAITPWS